jgi:hypothetical protein
MRHLKVVAVITGVTLGLALGVANAQILKDDAKGSPTGRTEDGLKNDEAIDKIFRAKAGQRTPEVRADPWADVRTPPAPPAPKKKL